MGPGSGGRAFRAAARASGVFTGRGGTIGWLQLPEALVVVDSQFAQSAQSCLEGLRDRSERKIDALINTHHHGDHTAGNGVFRPEAKLIVAHANVPGLQEKSAKERGNEAEQTYADTTFDKSWRIDAGAEKVSANHFGPAHTGGDCVVHFENANVAHMGDLIFNRWYPFIDRPGGASTRGWVEALDRVLAEHDKETLYIFGHGGEKFGITGSHEDVAYQRDYLTALLEAARKGIAAGQSSEELGKLESLQGFEANEAPGRRLSPRRQPGRGLRGADRGGLVQGGQLLAVLLDKLLAPELESRREIPPPPR